MTDSIWKYNTPTLAQLNRTNRGTLTESLGIEYIEVGPDYLKATMPVDSRTKQPAGLLHGGANVALAESICSSGGFLVLPPNKFNVVGLEINANHIKGIRDGYVIGKGYPIHIGRQTQVWECDISTPEGKRVCKSRITLANLPVITPTP